MGGRGLGGRVTDRSWRMLSGREEGRAGGLGMGISDRGILVVFFSGCRDVC